MMGGPNTWEGPVRRLIDLLVVLALPVVCLASFAIPVLAADPAPAGQVTYAVHFTLAPRWLDPGENEGSITPFLTLYAIHDALLKPMPNGPSAPCLAESWTVSPDGLVYEFLLRNGARFHNGEAVMADDVKFSFERYRGANAQVLKEKMKEVRIVDARRIQFRLKEPWPDFITFYGTTASSAGWVVPRKYLQTVGEDGFRKAPIGAGPYRVVSVNPGIEIVLEAFEGYWRKTPRVKRLVLRSLPDETTRAAALKRGDVDIAYFLNGPIAEDVRRTPGLKLTAVRSNTIFSLYFQDQWDAASPWRDPRVRLAASVAIDRKSLNEAEQLGFAGLTGSVVPRYIPSPRPTRARGRRSRTTWPPWASGCGSGPWNAPPFSRAGERASSRAWSSGASAPRATRRRVSRSSPSRAAPSPPGSSRKCRTSTSDRRASWIAASARSCSTRRSASCTIGRSSRPSGRTASSVAWGRGSRSRPSR